ncbi:MAG: tetratricopeptide repeat protein [Acidobacteriota bacterium]
MSRLKLVPKFLFAYIVVLSLMPQTFTLHAQDLVPTNSVSGGSSAFVFRGSRTKPQAHFASGYAFLGEAGGRAASVKRSNTQIAAAAKKRRAAAALARKKAIAAAANKKIKLSNTLTAKAEASLDANNFDSAIADLRSALVQNPKNLRARLDLSEALTEKGMAVAGDSDSEASIVYFDEAIKLDENNAAAYGKLAAVYDRTGANEKAAANYHKAIALDKELVSLNGPLGLTYVEMGDIAKAEDALHNADLGGVDTVETRNLRGLILFKKNMNAESLAAFDKTLQLDGRNVMANYYRGQVYARMDQPSNTIAAYKRTLEIGPGFAPASYDLGVAYYNSGDYNNAAAAYQDAIKDDPRNYQAHANLGSTYRQLERYAEANAEFKIASEGIKTADLYSEWGFCLGKADQWDEAALRLNTAHELGSTAIDNSNVGWAYYNGAEVDKANKNDAEAQAKLEKGKPYLQNAVAQDPKLDAAYLNLGSTYNGLGEFQDAVTALNIALGLHQDWVIAANQLGLGYRGLNDLTNAVATFKHVVDLDGSYRYGLFNLGEAYYASGNKKDARKVNDRLRKVDPVLATQLDNIVSGKVVVDAARQKIENKIPRIPRLPF